MTWASLSRIYADRGAFLAYMRRTFVELGVGYQQPHATAQVQLLAAPGAAASAAAAWAHASPGATLGQAPPVAHVAGGPDLAGSLGVGLAARPVVDARS